MMFEDPSLRDAWYAIMGQCRPCELVQIRAVSKYFRGIVECYVEQVGRSKLTATGEYEPFFWSAGPWFHEGRFALIKTLLRPRSDGRDALIAHAWKNFTPEQTDYIESLPADLYHYRKIMRDAIATDNFHVVNFLIKADKSHFTTMVKGCYWPISPAMFEFITCHVHVRNKHLASLCVLRIIQPRAAGMTEVTAIVKNYLRSRELQRKVWSDIFGHTVANGYEDLAKWMFSRRRPKVRVADFYASNMLHLAEEFGVELVTVDAWTILRTDLISPETWAAAKVKATKEFKVDCSALDVEILDDISDRFSKSAVFAMESLWRALTKRNYVNARWILGQGIHDWKMVKRGVSPMVYGATLHWLRCYDAGWVSPFSTEMARHLNPKWTPKPNVLVWRPPT